MRVVVLTTWFPSEERPVEAPFNLAHVRAIATRHRVVVVHVRLRRRDRVVREVYEGIDVVRVGLDPRFPGSVLRTVSTVRRALRRAELLHSMAFTGGALASVLRRRRLPWVHTEHWSGVLDPASVSPTWRRFAVIRRVLGGADRLTGVTTQLTAVLASLSSAPRCSVVPCVVENPLPVAERRRADGPRLIAVGGLVPGKRPVLAVETVAELRSRGVDATLEWIGDGPLRAEVESAVSRLHLGSAVRLRGAVLPAEVFTHLVDADLFFLPTLRENFFTSAAEALSAGLPVVAPRVGGFVDYLDDSNGVLVDAVSASSLADAITEAVARFAEVRPAAIADPIRARFSAQEIATQFDEVYRAARARR